MQNLFKLLALSLVILCSCKSISEHDAINHVVLSQGTNMAIAVSRDEQFMILDLQGALYRKEMDELSAKPITGYFMDARQPEISVDGNQVAFQSYKNGNWHIWTVESNGTQLIQLTDDYSDHREPTYNPVDQVIAYSSDHAGSYDIWTIHPITGNKTQLTTTDYNDYGPAYSSDGSKISFIRQTPEVWELNILNISSRAVTTMYSSNNKLYAPSWDLANESISFVEHNWLESTLKTINIQTGQVQNISDHDEDVFPFRVQHRSDGFYYTSDGTIKKLDSVNTKMIPFEVSLPVQRASYARKTPKLIDASVKSVKGIHCPKLSPNGKMISFIALGDVWIKDLYSDEIIRVTNDPYMQLMPAWHPNSSSLIYASDKGNNTAIWNYELSTKETKRLGQINVMPSGMSFSPDGTKIAYTMAFGPRSGRLSIMDYVTGDSTSPRSNFPYSTSAPSWHPDGKHILLSMLQPYSGLYREGIARNIIVNIETGETTIQQAPTALSFGARTNDAPIIADDASTLIYISKGQLNQVSLDQNLNITGDSEVLYPDIADAPSIDANQSKILFISGAQLKMFDRNSATIEEVSINLKYQAKLDGQTTIIHAGTVITMDDKILYNQDIVIRNQIIEQIIPHQERDHTGHVIDASDQYVIPGLIDMHAHQGSDLGTSLGYKWLAWGVTSTRDPATYPYDAQNRKEAQINGNILHPRIFYTGSPIDGNRVYYNGTYAQYSSEQIKRELGRSDALEFDLIKTYVRLPDSMQQQVINFAHNQGLPVTSHELYPAALMGIDGVEHIMGTSRRGYTPKMSETYRSYADVPSIMAAAEMTFTPTIGIYSGYNYMLSKHPELLEDNRIDMLESDYVKASGRGGIMMVEERPEDYKNMFLKQSKLIKEAHNKGVQIIAGTDSPIIPYGFSLFIELLCYQAAGLEPIEVLKTATINASEALNTDKQIGQIKEGMIADLLILKKDPTKDIMNLKSIEQVILSGKHIKLDEMLTQYSSAEY